MTAIIHINGKIPKSADKNPVFLGIVSKRYPPKKKKPAKIKEYPTIYPTMEDNPNVMITTRSPVIINE